MNHETIKELVFLSYDRELPQDQRIEVEKHLTACAECRTALANWKKIASVVFSAVEASPSEKFVQNVMRRIETQTPKPVPATLRFKEFLAKTPLLFPGPRWVLSGAAAMVLAAVFLLRPLQNPPPVPESAEEIEYTAHLMEGPFSDADTGDAGIGTTIEKYFL